jgi:hypothetical protein
MNDANAAQLITVMRQIVEELRKLGTKVDELCEVARHKKLG